MTIVPLDQIRFGWQSHWSALWWFFLLYRQPKEFQNVIEALTRNRRVIAAFACYIHCLPWMLIVVIVCKALLIGTGLVQPSFFGDSLGEMLWDQAESIAFGIVGGIAVGIAVGIVGGIAFGIAGGIALGIAFGIAVGFALGIAFGIAVGFALGIAFAIAFGINEGIALGIDGGIDEGIALGIAFGIAYGIAGGIAGGIAYGIAIGIAYGIAIGIAALRVYYIPMVNWMVWPKPQGKWYRWHPVAWDQMCSVPFPRLHSLLVAHFEIEPDAARREIERLIDTYPSQRWQALQAKATIVALDAGHLNDLAQLPAIVAALPEGQDGFLRQVPDLTKLIAPIAERQQQLDRAIYPTVRKQLSEMLIQEIESFRDRIAGFEEPLQSEFRKAASNWLGLVRGRLAEALSAPGIATAQLFRAGDPVNREQEAFVYRTVIVAELEQQVLLASGCPGIVLYGRRRMGKSTVLRNLTGFLPSTVPLGYVSMQDPLVFSSMSAFCQALVDAARDAKDWKTAPPAVEPNLSGLMRLLAWSNDQFGREKERLVLAIDEYEMIDTKIGEGVFSADLLPTIRESIQSHRNITWMFAGSHEIAELRHAEWLSYLVSARTVEVPPFTLAETRGLLTDPLRHSGLWRDKRERPWIAPEFWGENGIERIHADAGGWPHLVQLLAETAVDVVNAESVTAVSDDVYQRVRQKAIVRGENVLRQLLERECRLPGEWDYVSRFRRLETQPPPEDEAIHRSLRRRLLVEEVEGEWRLRVPLMVQWLRERG